MQETDTTRCWWHMSLIPARGRQRQVDLRLQELVCSFNVGFWLQGLNSIDPNYESLVCFLALTLYGSNRYYPNVSYRTGGVIQRQSTYLPAKQDTLHLTPQLVKASNNKTTKAHQISVSVCKSILRKDM